MAREHRGAQESWTFGTELWPEPETGLAGLRVLVRSSAAATLPGDVPLGSPHGLTQGLAAGRHGCTPFFPDGSAGDPD